MANEDVPWWAKTPTYLALGIVGVPSLIAIVAVGALINNNMRQGTQIDIAQKQTAEAIDLYRKALDSAIEGQHLTADSMHAVVNSFTDAIKEEAAKCDRAFKMSQYACEVDAHDVRGSQACKDFARDINQGLIPY